MWILVPMKAETEFSSSHPTDNRKVGILGKDGTHLSECRVTGIPVLCSSLSHPSQELHKYGPKNRNAAVPLILLSTPNSDQAIQNNW